MSLSALAQLNGIAGPDYVIRAGQVLRLPGSGSVAPSSPSPSPAPTSVPASGTTVTVQAGDTLAQLAQRYGVEPEALAQLNGITGPEYLIRIGQVLTLPASPFGAPSVHASGATVTVQPGDTLSQLAQRHGVSIEAMARLNGIAGPLYAIRSGQVLRLPRTRPCRRRAALEGSVSITTSTLR